MQLLKCCRIVEFGLVVVVVDCSEVDYFQGLAFIIQDCFGSTSLCSLARGGRGRGRQDCFGSTFLRSCNALLTQV